MAEEKSLADVADKISAGNMQIDLMAKSLDDVKMESSTGELAVKQIKDLMEKQSSMTAKEQRASRKQIDAIAKMIQDSSEIGDSDKQKFRMILQQHDERIKSDSSLMGQVGNQISERLVQSVTNIGATVGGVVSDSPLLAMGVKFLGDSVVKGVQTFKAFKKRNKEEEELRQKQQKLFKEQERIDSEERRVLREQLTEKDLQSKLNLTEEDIQRKAEELNRSREDIINEEKDKIIEQSKIAKQIKDNEKAEAKRISELKDSAGLVTAADEEKEQAKKEKRKAEKENEEAEVDQITGETGERIESSLVSRVTEGGDSDTTTSTNIIREIGADFPEVVPVSSPFLKEIRDLLEFLSSQQSQGELDAIETEREKRRSDQANLRVERAQNSIIEDSIESAEAERAESKGAFETIASGIGMFKGILRFLMNLPKVLAMGFSAIFSPIGLKIMAVGAGIAAVVAFFRSDLPQKIGEFVSALPEKINEAISGLFDSFKSFIREMLSKIPGIGSFFGDDDEEESNENSTPTPNASNRRGRGPVGSSPSVSQNITNSNQETNNPNITTANQETNIDESVSTLPAPELAPPINNVVVLDERRRSGRRGRGSRRGLLGLDSPNIESAETENVSIIPTELAQGTQSPSQGVAVREGALIPAGESAPIEQVSGAPTQELGNISSPMAGVRSSAAAAMKESAIEKSAATNISPILNNLSNVTNNNVSNSSSTVIPTKAYNTENSFNKINSALSGAV